MGQVKSLYYLSSFCECFFIDFIETKKNFWICGLRENNDLKLYLTVCPKLIVV